MVQQQTSQQPQSPGQETVVATTAASVPMKSAVVKGVEEGRYRLVGWAVDTTGRRLIDEICQIAVYTPDSQFSQYIMPFSDIRLVYRRRHSIRVMNVGKYRMLKDLHTNKFVKTKSEVSALTEFLGWLEQVKGDASDGIILLFHEFHKHTPAMLLESLRRHGLSERFAKVVKGFANCHALARDRCATATKSFGLRVMAKVLLDKDEDISNAVTRARTCYDIVVHLGQAEVEDLDAKGSGDCKGNEAHLVDLVRPYANPIQAEEDEIAEFKLLLDRQNTFKPVFGALLRATPVERQHASHLRRILAENNIDYDQLKNAFDNGAKDGLEKLLAEKVVKTEGSNVKDDDMKQLLEILDCFFDPEKKPVQPKTRYYANNNHNTGGPRKYHTPNNRRPVVAATTPAADADGKDKNANTVEEADDALAAKVEGLDLASTLEIKNEPLSQPEEAAAPPAAAVSSAVA